MKNSWTTTFRRLAATAVVAGTTVMSSAMCYALNAADSAADPVYSPSWDAGDNGGSGFGAWNFDGSYASALHQTVPPGGANDLGTAWGLGFTSGTDVSRAGRALSLGVGETFSTTIDSPSTSGFFGGFIVRLNSGGGSICYAGAPCTPGTTPVERLSVFHFNYGDLLWDVNGVATPLGLTDSDAGMRIDVTLQPGDMYDIVLTPLGPGAAPPFVQSGALAGSGPIDWIEFTHFSRQPGNAADFFIGPMSIVPEPGTATLFVLGGGGALVGLAGARRRRTQE